MNKNYLLRVIREFLPNRVELVDSYKNDDTTSIDFQKYTYESIVKIASNI